MADTLPLFPDVEPPEPAPPKRQRVDLKDADPGTCKGCGASILWAMRAGRPHPYNPDATSHFNTCPKADAFRGRTREREA